jgi:hypothetical protein
MCAFATKEKEMADVKTKQANKPKASHQVCLFYECQ